MSGATKLDHLDFAKSEFIEQHGDIILELANRCGSMAGQGDKLGLVIMAAHVKHVCEAAFDKYDKQHRKTEGIQQ